MIRTLGRVAWAALLLAGWGLPAPAAADTLLVETRHRIESPKGSGQFEVRYRTTELDPAKTAVVICDMWDRHWCRGATRRVAEMAPRMNALVKALRAQGMLIIHCPSDTMKYYEGTPQRRLAQSAPKVDSPVPLQRWCSRDPEHEPPLPIDDSDGGCDDDPPCSSRPPYPWTHQIDIIEIAPRDAVTDSAEAYYLMRQRGIQNVLVMGVHLNMCVLGRPFAIRQLVRQGLNVILVRDLTDTMYNSRRKPFVPHCAGTDLMIEHVEKYWCPTVTSAAFLGGAPFRFKEDTRPHVVFMIGEDEYHTWETLPAFAKAELPVGEYAVEIIQQDPDDKHRFPGLLQALPGADLLVLSVRRRIPPREQLEAVWAHLQAGKPLVGIRTASHAFAARSPNDPALKRPGHAQ